MQSGLQRRLLTAALLVPLTLVAVLYLPTPAFALLWAAVLATGVWEWARLCGLDDLVQKSLLVMGFFAALAGLWFVIPREADLLLLVLACCWWLLTAWQLARLREIPLSDSADWGLVGLGLLVLGAPWLALVRLHGIENQGPWLVIGLLMLIWITDSAAYFVGRQWGRRKLAPLLSPGKTWIGVYGGLIGAGLWGLVIAASLALDGSRGIAFVLLCGLVAALSVVGDLYESQLKRRRGLKDSGALLPGHGGMLDRIDSLTAAAPLFCVGLLWLENGL